MSGDWVVNIVQDKCWLGIKVHRYHNPNMTYMHSQARHISCKDCMSSMMCVGLLMNESLRNASSIHCGKHAASSRAAHAKKLAIVLRAVEHTHRPIEPNFHATQKTPSKRSQVKLQAKSQSCSRPESGTKPKPTRRRGSLASSLSFKIMRAKLNGAVVTREGRVEQSISSLK
jgi:hypothetical protein